MKNGFLNYSVLTIALITLLNAGCKKDDDFTLAKCLSDTDWSVTSFQEDGNELIGSASVYSAASLEFGKYSKADQRGSITFELIENGGGTAPLPGNYEIFESTSEVEITFTGYLPTTFTATCTEQGRLTLKGNLDGFGWIIEAREK